MTTNAKILLAEDDPIAARHLRKSLFRMGYQVAKVAQAGEEVIEDIAEIMPDIILMDINLGGKIDGICAVQKVHALFDTPVIYITANSDNETFERAKLTEPYAYLIKPYDIYQMQNAIEIALFKHGLKKQLQSSENRYRTIFEVSDNAMMLVDENSTITMVNEQFETLTGFSKESVENRKNWTDFFDENECSKLEKQIRQAINAPSTTRPRFESSLVDKKGNTKFVYTNVKRIPESGSVIFSMNDISELKLAEKEINALNQELNTTNEGLKKEITLREGVERQLRYKATHDHLTGLPNRVLLFDRLKQAFAFEARHNTLIALMILDLDNFKNVNDTLGHLSGDILLKKIAEGLQKCMRQYDTVGRMGGDEFVLIINDADTIHDIITFAEKVQAVFQEPFDILGHQTHVTTSIGVAVCPLHGSTIEILLKKADMAMYLAKKEGRNTYRFYSDSMDIKNSYRQNAMRTKRRLAQMQESTLDHMIAQNDDESEKCALVN
ncbi:diguanylate cyclase [Candidatus Roizmanbacteria bacterium]|nr:diguanylate cyclase [Candidatus Roizmanbacteria bacterium]